MRLKSMLTVLALSLSTLSATAAPALAKEQDKPEPARVYKDWVVGCRYFCEAVVVLPEGDAEGYVLTMSMEANEYASEDLSLSLHDPIGETLLKANGPYRLLVDGKVAVTFQWDDYEESWGASVKRNTSSILARGKKGEIVDKNGKRVSLISLSGATAAMRYMDEQMGIVGYKHALVAKGKARKVDDPVGVFVPAPLIRASELVLSTPPLITDVIDVAIKLSGCAEDRDDVDARFDAIHPLKRKKGDPDLALILVGCGHGAYNYMTMPYLATREKDGQWTLMEIIVDMEQFGDLKRPMGMLTNAHWDAEGRTLTHFNKGRGLGDCGDSAVYNFVIESGRQSFFRIAEIREMPVCRGATHWPAIW